MQLRPEDKVMLNLFHGPGGGERGMRYAGWHSTDAVDFDKAVCQTFRVNFPDVKVHECDITQLLVAQYTRRYFPLAFYTFPCDRYSAIANVHGCQTGDDLYLHCLRNLVLLWHEVIIIENVVGLRKFPIVMELWRNLAHYFTTELTVFGEDFTLQRKTRVFLILHRQEFQFSSLDNFTHQYEIPMPIIVAKPGCTLMDYLDKPEDRTPQTMAEIEIHPYIRKRLNGAYRDLPKLYHPSQTTPINLTTNYKRDRGVALVADDCSDCGYRPFSVREVARLHGFPDTHVFCGNKNERYCQVVDAVMPPVSYALGTLVNAYFESIPALAPQPRPLGYRFISTPRCRSNGLAPASFNEECQFLSTMPV